MSDYTHSSPIMNMIPPTQQHQPPVGSGSLQIPPASSADHSSQQSTPAPTPSNDAPTLPSESQQPVATAPVLNTTAITPMLSSPYTPQPTPTPPSSNPIPTPAPSLPASDVVVPTSFDSTVISIAPTTTAPAQPSQAAAAAPVSASIPPAPAVAVIQPPPTLPSLSTAQPTTQPIAPPAGSTPAHLIPTPGGVPQPSLQPQPEAAAAAAAAAAAPLQTPASTTAVTPASTQPSTIPATAVTASADGSLPAPAPAPAAAVPAATPAPASTEVVPQSQQQPPSQLPPPMFSQYPQQYPQPQQPPSSVPSFSQYPQQPPTQAQPHPQAQPQQASQPQQPATPGPGIPTTTAPPSATPTPAQTPPAGAAAAPLQSQPPAGHVPLPPPAAGAAPAGQAQAPPSAGMQNLPAPNTLPPPQPQPGAMPPPGQAQYPPQQPTYPHQMPPYQAHQPHQPAVPTHGKVPPPQFYRYVHPTTRYSSSNRDASVPFRQSHQLCMTYYQAIEKNKKLPRNYRFAPINTHHPLYTLILQGQAPPKNIPLGVNAPPSSTSGRSSGRIKNFDESQHISTMIGLCGELLASLTYNPKYQIFCYPVDPVLHGCPDYFDVVKEPMDLNTIRERLTKGKYPTQYEFASDVRLVFNNAMIYNPEGHTVHMLAKEALQFFEERFLQLGQQQIMYGNQMTMAPPSIYHTGGGGGGGSSKPRKSTGKSTKSRKSGGGQKRGRKNDYDDDDDDDDDISDEMYYRYYGTSDLSLPPTKSRQSSAQQQQQQQQQQAQAQQALFWQFMQMNPMMNQFMAFNPATGMQNPAALAGGYPQMAPDGSAPFDAPQFAASASMKKGAKGGMPPMSAPRPNKKSRGNMDPTMMGMPPLVPQALNHRLSYDPSHVDQMMHAQQQQPYMGAGADSAALDYGQASGLDATGGLAPGGAPTDPAGASVSGVPPPSESGGNDVITDEEIDALSLATQQLSEEKTYGLLDVLKIFIPDLDDSSDIDLGVLKRPQFLQIQAYVNNALSESSNVEASQPLQSPTTINQIPSRYNDQTLHSPQPWSYGSESDED